MSNVQSLHSAILSKQRSTECHRLCHSRCSGVAFIFGICSGTRSEARCPKSALRTDVSLRSGSACLSHATNSRRSEVERDTLGFHKSNHEQALRRIFTEAQCDYQSRCLICGSAGQRHCQCSGGFSHTRSCFQFFRAMSTSLLQSPAQNIRSPWR